MSHGDGVDELGISTELEACPAAIAVSDCNNLLILLLQGLSVLLDLRPADFLVVAANEVHQVEALSLLWVGKHIRVDDFAFKAAVCQPVSFLRRSLNASQVRDVDGRLRLLCEMVRDKANVRKSPTEDVGDDEDCGILGVASNIRLRVVEGGLLARGLATPLEAGFAVLARHRVRILSTREITIFRRCN